MQSSAKASNPVVRLKTRPKLTASTQMMLSKANRTWTSKTAKAFACWRHSKDMRRLAFLSAGEAVKHALRNLLRKAMFGKLTKDAEIRRCFARHVHSMDRLVNGKIASDLRVWAMKSRKTGESDYLMRRRMRTFLTYIRQANSLSLRNGFHLWRKSSLKDLSQILQAQQLSAIKFRISLTAILRQALFSKLKRKSNLYWAFRRLEKSAKRFDDARVAACLLSWRDEVETIKSQRLVEMTMAVGTILAGLRTAVRAAVRTRFESWKEVVPKYRTLRVNGKRVKSRVSLGNGTALAVQSKTVARICELTVLRVNRKPVLFPAQCYSGAPLAVYQRVAMAGKLESDLKLLRRTFLTLSTTAFHRKMLAFDIWTERTAAQKTLNIEHAHTLREMVAILHSWQIDRISTAFRSMKVPKTVKRLHSAFRNITKSYKFLVQKGFYRWSGSAKSLAALQQIAVLKLFSLAKRVVKRRFFTPILDVAGEKDTEKRCILVLNRIFLKGIGREVQKWYQKTTEAAVIRLQESMKKRRLKVLMVAWMGKDKAFYFQKLKGITRNRSLKEKYLNKMMRFSNKKRLKTAFRTYRGAAKLLTKQLSVLKNIRKITHRRMILLITQLKRFPRPHSQRSESNSESYIDKTMKTLKSSLDRAPLPKHSFFQTLFRG